MGYYCTVPQCTSLAGKTKNVKFHRFPRDVSMADRWNVILRRGKPYTKYSKVCSLHFTQGDYNVTTMGQWKTLSKDAVPSQNLPKLNPDGSVMVIRKSRTVKYRESRKEESDKSDKWILPSHTTIRDAAGIADIQADNEANIAYRLQALSAVASTLSSAQSIPVPLTNQTISIPHPQPKPRKQDAFMQTDPVQSEEDDTQPNNSYSETSETSFNSELETYPYQARGSPYQKQVSPYQKEVPYQKEQLTKEQEYVKYEKEKEYAQYQKETRNDDKKFELPKDYTKQEDYIPQTNEEYNKEAEKYALERKSHNGYEKVESAYQKSVPENQYQKEYQKTIQDQYQKLPEPYQKLPEIYSFSENEYQNRTDYVGYQNGYPDSEILRNKQHNLEILQETHRITENQNFFNESHIKQEIDINSEEEKFLYERTKDQLVADANSMYNSSVTQQRLLEQLQHHVKQEPEANACESVMQPQGSPYYANGHNNGPGFYEPLSRPGPEMLIAKQNALAAHTQLWQNTMKRPFFYTETSNFPAPQLLHRHTEGYNRVLQ